MDGCSFFGSVGRRVTAVQPFLFAAKTAKAYISNKTCVPCLFTLLHDYFYRWRQKSHVLQKISGWIGSEMFYRDGLESPTKMLSFIGQELHFLHLRYLLAINGLYWSHASERTSVSTVEVEIKNCPFLTWIESERPLDSTFIRVSLLDMGKSSPGPPFPMCNRFPHSAWKVSWQWTMGDKRDKQEW